MQRQTPGLKIGELHSPANTSWRKPFQSTRKPSLQSNQNRKRPTGRLFTVFSQDELEIALRRLLHAPFELQTTAQPSFPNIRPAPQFLGPLGFPGYKHFGRSETDHLFVVRGRCQHGFVKLLVLLSLSLTLLLCGYSRRRKHLHRVRLAAGYIAFVCDSKHLASLVLLKDALGD